MISGKNYKEKSEMKFFKFNDYKSPFEETKNL